MQVPISQSYQQLLIDQLHVLFPETQIFTNVRKSVDIKHPSTLSCLEFDVWIPKLNLCFEFQDAYHYTTTWYYQSTQERIEKRDKIKQIFAQRKGMSLIVVPCWWPGDPQSLGATIKLLRPDLIQSDFSSPIPLNPPHHFFNDFMIPGIGELMVASYPLYSSFNSSISSFSWWIGEKYDGIRFSWNSDSNTLYSRTGYKLNLPHNFLFLYPTSIFAEGEFWCGRGQYSMSTDLVLKSNESDLTSLRAVVFDVPSQECEQMPFETRYSLLLSQFNSNHPFAFVAARVKYKNKTQIKEYIKDIIADEGEGLIMRRERSLYHRGRSQSLLKLKAAQHDREGIVVSIESNGSVLLKVPSGKTFIVPSENIQIPTPSLGDIVSFFVNREKSTESQGPIIFKIRNDLSWDDVVFSASSERAHITKELRERLYKNVPQNLIITKWDINSRRQFFEKYARENNFDPKIAENWYLQSRRKIILEKNSRIVVSHHGNSVKQALVDLFPDIGLDKSLFWNKSSLFENENMRKYFFKYYATVNNFDYRDVESWYSQSPEKKFATKGALGVIAHHKGSFVQSLFDLFPDLSFDKNKFFQQSSDYILEERRKPFELFAKENDFDPLQASNWYLQTQNKILEAKGVQRIVSQNKGNLIETLVDAFPTIGLDKSKLWQRRRSGYWLQ